MEDSILAESGDAGNDTPVTGENYYSENILEDESINFMVEDDDKLLDYEDENFAVDSKDADNNENNEEDTRRTSTSTSNREKDNHRKENKTKSSEGENDGNKSKERDSKKTKLNVPENSLWVSGLATSTRAQDLKILFLKYGKVQSAKIVTNTKTPGAKCFGYVTMANKNEVIKCIENTNQTELHGRIIQVEEAKGEPGGASRKRVLDAKKINLGGTRSMDDKKDPRNDNRGPRSPMKGRDMRRGPSNGEDRGERGKPYDRHSRRPVPPRNRRAMRFSPEKHVLTLTHIMREREQQSLRAHERMLREKERERHEEEQFHRNVEMRQREESDRLLREREKLRLERERIDRQKQELLRMEREQQKMERENLKRERDDLRQQRMDYETESTVKRSVEPRGYKEHSYDNRDDRKRPMTNNSHITRTRYETSPRRYEQESSTRAPHRLEENSRGNSRTVSDSSYYGKPDDRRHNITRSVDRNNYKSTNMTAAAPSHSRERSSSRYGGSASAGGATSTGVTSWHPVSNSTHRSNSNSGSVSNNYSSSNNHHHHHHSSMNSGSGSIGGGGGSSGRSAPMMSNHDSWHQTRDTRPKKDGKRGRERVLIQLGHR